MQTQISWLLQKPTDLDLHCSQRHGISGFRRTRLNTVIVLEYLKIFFSIRFMIGGKSIKNIEYKNRYILIKYLFSIKILKIFIV